MKNTIFMLCLFFGILVNGQEGQFSQYQTSWIITNPAFLGTIPTISFNTNYKRAGSESDDSFFELMQTTVTYPFKRVTSKDFQTGGVGLSVFRERRGAQGIYQAQKVLLTGAYALQLSRINNQSVIFSLQGGVAENRINTNNLTWGSQFNKYIGFDDLKQGENIPSDPVFYPVFNFGVVYSTYDNENYYIRDRNLVLGLSVDNLNRPKISSVGLDNTRKRRLYKAFGSSEFPLSPRLHIHPSVYFLYLKGSTQINTGLYFSTFVSSPQAQRALKVQVGSWYRFGDSVILLAGLDFEEFKIGASLDLNTKTLGLEDRLTSSQPTFEISLAYNLIRSEKSKSVSNPIF
jgi:type IX secretion system PorP/SprF family membrane protein